MEFMKKSDKTVLIESVYPELDSGRYAVKRRLGETLEVYADAFQDGHHLPVVELRYRNTRDKNWNKVPMTLLTDHRYKANFVLEKIGVYEYIVEAASEEGGHPGTKYDRILQVVVDSPRANFAAWYEMWPRSQGTVEGCSATFADMKKRLKEISWMGFDVVYLTPIHPIGITNHKGPNNSLVASEKDPGCPYSIGNHHGGHKAVDPALGTLDDFRDFVKTCNVMDIEVALDIVFTCSPDHPYIQQHPDWFFHNEDGTIKYAENPPKKYEDVCTLNFYPKNYLAMWDEMTSIFMHWAEYGVKTFRVDNPHTKPLYFWKYCIKKVKDKYPEAIFLSEAFTHPKMMRFLAKTGFTQSYTYFTWRNTKWELTSYLKELTQTEMSEYFQGNFFANTPDILPEYLQRGGRNAFKIRSLLASTLSSVYGIYNGFELCENAAIPGKEEYINSEKYQHKVWDWERKGHIKPFLRALNKIRKENLALQLYKNLEFVETNNNQVLAYTKITPDLTNIILVVVNLDPYHTQESSVIVPHERFGIGEQENYTVTDLLSGFTFIWKGHSNYVKLNPHIEPAHIFRINKWKHYEQDILAV